VQREEDAMPKPSTGPIDKPPRKGSNDPSGKLTDNPKLPKQAGGGRVPSGSGKSNPHAGLKRGG